MSRSETEKGSVWAVINGWKLRWLDDAFITKARQGLPKPILYRRFVFNTKLLGVVAELKVNHFNGK